MTLPTLPPKLKAEIEAKAYKNADKNHPITQFSTAMSAYVEGATAMYSMLREERAEMIEGLEYYGNEEKWVQKVFGVASSAEVDGGDRARALLAKVRKDGK